MNTSNQVTFETGATSYQANNLILSVLNDGKVYQDRLHCGYALLQGSYNRVSIKDIVTNEANKQRKEFKSKFKAAEITEAVKIITKETIEDCLEIIKDQYINSRSIDCVCRRWFDKSAGNSYFSVNIQIPCKSENNLNEVVYRQINIPFSYGYGSQWQYEVINLLVNIGILPVLPVYENGNKDYGYMSDYERKGIVIWHDDGHGLKRDMFNGLYI